MSWFLLRLSPPASAALVAAATIGATVFTAFAAFAARDAAASSSEAARLAAGALALHDPLRIHIQCAPLGGQPGAPWNAYFYLAESDDLSVRDLRANWTADGVQRYFTMDVLEPRSHAPMPLQVAHHLSPANFHLSVPNITLEFSHPSLDVRFRETFTFTGVHSVGTPEDWEGKPWLPKGDYPGNATLDFEILFDR